MVLSGESSEDQTLEQIILVSTPWPLYSRPSVQLGTLKAYLKEELPDLRVHAFHAFLKVAESLGYKTYGAISERTWLAETVYGAMLYPERSKKIEKIFSRETKDKSELRGLEFETVTSQVKETTDKLISRIDWGAYSLAGFSICLCQLTSTLYFVRQIKEKFPKLIIVIGGSAFAGDSAPSLLKAFPEIDFVVIGEGELPLSQLISNLREGQNPEDVPPIPGLVTGKAATEKTVVSFSQMGTLTNLPPPDYDDYFHLLRTLGPKKAFFPTLPAEISRGCWWKRSQSASRRGGCAFCNLNLQWDGYRSKSPKQVVYEIDHLTTKYKTLSVAFMDNLLPLKTSEDIFKQLETLKKDFRFFAEIRASTPIGVLTAMRAAGTQEVQIGIEALSTRLLKKLNKGTTAIQNLEVMKACEELGIANVSNLILHFPGSDIKDVKETLRTLEFSLPFRPLRFVHFWLGLGSPVWQDPAAVGLKAVFNHPHYGAIFPRDVVRSIRFTIQGYRGDLVRQRKLWQPVKEKVRAWKKMYNAIHAGPGHSPILSYRDGRDFLIIRQKRWEGEPMTHRLKGTSRAIYLYCGTHRPLNRIFDHFPQVAQDKIVPFLKMMVDKKLMFEEEQNYLSLAVPAERHSS